MYKRQVQYRGDANNDSGLLGFASPYTKDAAFEKRKSTQDSWAYGHGVTVNIDSNEDISVTGEGTRGGYGAGEKWDATMLFIANCHPRIIDNTPMTGFEIAKTVRRYGWGGGGNVKWRITDPRGFDLEISSENFASVLACTTMVNGVIQEECVWGRQGANNILLPVTSDPYKEATKQTTLVNSKVSMKDVGIGDTITVLTSQTSTGNLTGTYLGKVWIVSSGQIGEDSYYDHSRYTASRIARDVIARFLVRSDEDNKIYAFTTMKVAAIDKKAATPGKVEDMITWVNEQISEGKSDFVNLGYGVNPVIALAKESDAKKIKVTLAPTKVKMNGGLFALVKGDYDTSYEKPAQFMIIKKADGSLWLPYNSRKGYDKHEAYLYKLATSFEQLQEKLELRLDGSMMDLQTQNRHYSYHQRQEFRLCAEPFNNDNVAEAFEVNLEVDNVKARLITTPTPLGFGMRDIR